jgi:site-specific recombinase XerD
MPHRQPPPDEATESLLDSYELSLRARNRSPRTVQNYLAAVELLDAFLADRTSPLRAERRDLEAFTADQLARHSSSTAATRFRCLQQWYRWATEEGLLERSPMDGMTPPKLDEKVVPVLSDEQLRALLGACDGKRFEDRRDAALVRFMLDTGARLAETAELSVADVQARAQEAVVAGKGGRERRVYFSTSTAVTLDRYLRERRVRRWASNSALWLGPKGPLTDSGVAQLIRRRGRLAGIEGLHPHVLRHTWAHLMKVAGMPDDEVMALGGWRTGQMLARYGSAATSERARQTYTRMAPGDRLSGSANT